MNQFIITACLCVLGLTLSSQPCYAGSTDESGVFEDYVQEKLDALEKKLVAEISALKKENTVLKDEAKKLGEELKEGDKKLGEELREGDKKLTEKLYEADKKQVSTTRCLAQKVGFMATFAKYGHTKVRGGQTAVYGKVITNVGNAYNPNNGRFTVRSPGLYAFTVTAYKQSKNSVSNLNIKVNNDVVTSERVSNWGLTTHDAATARAVVQLSAGDVVTVWAGRNYDPHTMFQERTYAINANTFSGELIQPDCPQ